MQRSPCRGPAALPTPHLLPSCWATNYQWKISRRRVSNCSMARTCWEMDHWNPSGGEGFEADVAPELLFKDVQTCSRAGPLGAAAFLPAVPCQGTEAPTELCTPCLRRAPASASWPQCFHRGVGLLLSGLSRLEAVGHLRVLEGHVGSGAGLELVGIGWSS